MKPFPKTLRVESDFKPSHAGLLRENYARDSVQSIMRNKNNVGANGVRKGYACAYFQSSRFDKACGNSLLLAFVERKVRK